MSLKVSSSTVVFVSACLVLVSTGYSQPRGSQPQQAASSHNFYITTPQTGESTPVGGTASTQAALNTYTGTTSWQPSNTAQSSGYTQASAAASRQTTSRRASSSSVSANSHAAAYNTYNNYYANANQQTAQQTVYPSYVAHASAPSTVSEKKGLLSRLLPGRSQQHQTSKVTQVSNNVKRSRFSGTTQDGTASWYGSDWHGKKTANGERYNMESMTAAHRTLPFGTLVKVRNERNGRECVVRINNRGPFTKGRILDLSKAAARQLGMVGSGIAKVKMEVLGQS